MNRRGRVAMAALLVVSAGCASSDADPVASSAPGTDTPSTPAPTTNAPTTPAPTAPATTLALSVPPTILNSDRLLELVTADLTRLTGAPGEIVSVYSPSRGIDLTVAVGTEARNSGTPLRAESTVRLTSTTKTYVAAAVLLLVERGDFALSDPIAAAGVSPALVELLRSDTYDVDAITVEQLLTHTSGIADYAGAPDYATAPYTLLNAQNPQYTWTRDQQVQFAIANYDPLAAPGAEYHYSDTNYILLGDLLEVRTQLGLGEALRSTIGPEWFGTVSTHIELLEPTPPTAGPRAAQYSGSFDSRLASPTIDLYGGGGLVSSMPEVALFFHALGTGEVFANRSTFATMSTVTEQGSDVGAAAGLFRVEIEGNECFGHRGSYGTYGVVCPSIDLAIARAWNQAALPDESVLELLIAEIVFEVV